MAHAIIPHLHINQLLSGDKVFQERPTLELSDLAKLAFNNDQGPNHLEDYNGEEFDINHYKGFNLFPSESYKLRGITSEVGISFPYIFPHSPPEPSGKLSARGPPIV